MWHIGVFYRINDLLKLVHDTSYQKGQILIDFPSYQGVNTNKILELALIGGWLEEQGQECLILTRDGKRLVKATNVVIQLRMLIKSLIEKYDPNLGALALQGRKTFIEYAPIDVVQCFREAKLLDGLDTDVIQWWCDIHVKAKSQKDVDYTNIGRKGEMLSYEYEKKRVGEDPYWVALEYDGAGYDLVSRLNSTDKQPLLIEVKTTSVSWDDGKFYMTRHEWNTLSSSQNAVIHLWSLYCNHNLHRIIHIHELRSHVPSDQGGGRWEKFHCDFSHFSPL